MAHRIGDRPGSGRTDAPDSAGCQAAGSAQADFALSQRRIHSLQRENRALLDQDHNRHDPPMTTDVTIRTAAAEEHGRAAKAYEAWGYGSGVRPDDVVYVAEAGGELVGVVRRAVEHGVTMLRGMQIAPEWRRRGVGSQLLAAFVADLAGAECHCIPYTHLVGFYGAGGFAIVEEADAPAFLQARLAEYRARGLSVLVMRRPAGAAP
jgi:GNAT superfamily N-acetyltransferase